MATARKVTVIAPTINPMTHMPVRAALKRKVAGYARVSTDKDEQFTSYEAQVDYYTKFINQNPDWEFVKVYTDEGITGTSTKHREGFKQMITDALAGKIDLIVTKSVSRFARNTVDSLVTIRQLKDSGVECFFEKENIYTFDGKGELLLTIMSSLAQEESRSISENVKWGQRKRFEDGKVTLPYKHFLGYDRGEDKDSPPVVNEEQAVIVRRIYHLFMSGKTTWSIAKLLTAERIPTPAGKEQWRTSTIESILSNEKYKGSARLQKEFVVDFLTKKKKPNEGELPQFYIEESHEAIIPPDEWEIVQAELARRRYLRRKYSGNSVFSTRLVCHDCGGFYGPKVWNSTDKYRRVVWQCNDKFKGDEKCATPHIEEEALKARFMTVFNVLIKNKKELLRNCEVVRNLIAGTEEIDSRIDALYEELEVVSELARKCIDENARTAQDQTEFLSKYQGLEERFNTVKEEIDRLEAERVSREAKGQQFRIFINAVEKQNGELTEFSDRLWLAVIDIVTVMPDGRLVFRFRNGMELEG